MHCYAFLSDESLFKVDFFVMSLYIYHNLQQFNLCVPGFKIVNCQLVPTSYKLYKDPYKFLNIASYVCIKISDISNVNPECFALLKLHFSYLATESLKQM